MGWREFLGISPEGSAHSEFPLGGNNSEELLALMSGWINVAGTDGLSGVSEQSALGIPAFSRGVELITGTIAGLPLKTYEGTGESRRQVPSMFDDPSGPYELSPFSWVETMLQHLVIYREAYLVHLRNVAGVLIGLFPTHPDNVLKVEWVDGGAKRYTVKNGAESVVYGTLRDPVEGRSLTQVLGPSTTGLRGTPLFRSHKRTFQIAIAAEKASARTFTGALVGGLVTPAEGEDFTEEEAGLILDHLNARISGTDNAGRLAMVNRHLDLKSWQMSNLDAQFAESRAFQVEEFARMLGLMPVHLAQTEKQTSWGTGVAEQNLGLARYCLMHYTSRFESAVRPLLPPDQFVEFDYKGLLQGTPKDEVELLIAETGGGAIITPDEARAVLNLGPMPKQTAPATAPQEDANV